MIRQMSIVACALIAGLACGINDLSAQETLPEEEAQRRPPGVVSKEESYKKLPKAGGRTDRVEVHVKKMLALAMELREGGFHEEAQVLIQQAKRLASKKRKPTEYYIRNKRTYFEVQPAPDRIGLPTSNRHSGERVPSAKTAPEPVRRHRVAIRRARLHQSQNLAGIPTPTILDPRSGVIDPEKIEHRRAMARFDVARSRYQTARRKKADMAWQESDLNGRVERLAEQVRALRHMIQDLKRALDKSDRHMRRGPVSK